MNDITLGVESRKRFIVSVVFLLTLLFSNLLPAYGAMDTKAPSSLKQWEDWVMYGNEQYACPSLYNDFNEFRCVWPELLNLDFSSDGGSFKQLVTVLSESWFYLPGDRTNWPLSVMVDEQKIPVLLHENKPAIKINEGKHTVSGFFKWTMIPQSFSISKTTGLVALRVNNKVVNEPFIDKTGKLWIQKKTGELSEPSTKESNIINTQIYRLIEDTIPLQIKTIVRITVSGESRREKLMACIPENVATVSVKTPLPVKLVDGGTLLVDVRPGKWEINLLSIVNDPAYQFKPAPGLYGDELWAYKPHPALRLARIEGLTPIDPAQTNLPSAWKRFSTYLVKKGDAVLIKEIKRGSPDSIADALNLKRELWLDFDGKGATVKDNITGLVGKRLFFSMEDGGYELGRVNMHGEDKLVTLYKGSAGVELERGQVNLMAVSRMGKLATGDDFSLGWKSKFKTAEGVLNLPPGWRLLGLQGGTAEYRSTWIDSWSLLDFFLILVVSFAVAKLYNRLWGTLFFIGLIFIAHETGAPFYLWFVLIATTALFNTMQDSEIKERTGLLYKGVRFFHYVTVIVLAVICFIFIANQIKVMVYPQLESVRGHNTYNQDIEFEAFSPALETAHKKMPKKSLSKRDALRDMVEGKRNNNSYIEQRQYQLSQQNIVTQTGPGIPSWNWRQVRVNFGAVSETHKIKLWLTSPFQNSIFSALRVLLLMLMLYRLANVKLSNYFKKNVINSVGKVLVVLFLFILFSPNTPGAFAELPSTELLAELEKRLTAPPDCFPGCAVITEAKIILPDSKSVENKKQFIEISLTVNSAVDAAIPLPSGSGNWQLYDLVLDNKPHLAVVSEGDTLWTYIQKGVHTLKIRGIAYSKEQFQFSFPLKPAYVETDSVGWNISGINSDHQVETVIQASVKDFAKSVSLREKAAGIDKQLTTFLRVKRTFTLGLEWNIKTTVERFVRAQDQQNIVVDIPLLKSELIRTEAPALSIDKGIATVSMASQDNKIEWRSSIPISSQIDLTATKDSRWTEVWELKQSSLWHSSFKGPPVIYPDDRHGSFWYPWPGEHLTLYISKLDSAPGESMTIDSVRADYYIGNGYNRILLNTKIRTTSGRTHEIASPINTFVERISINGVNFPFVGNLEKISLPLQPGTQNIEIEWNESQQWANSWFKSLFIPKKIKFPDIDVGSNLNNIDVYIHLPDKLWLLWTGGPRLGPAVLAWSMIGAVLIISLVLGRVNFSPLTRNQWLILGLGLVSLTVPEMIILACWFFAIEIRRKKSIASPFLFNLTQVVLITWTVFIVVACIKAISNGLIGIPDMQISGNYSNANKLHWTLDHSDGFLPKPWVIIYSMYIYQLVMLIWALWLSLNVMNWAKLCMVSLKSDCFWKSTGLLRKKSKVVKKDSI